MTGNDLEYQIDNFSKFVAATKQELSKSIVGMNDVISTSLTALFAGGHLLLEGAPGLGKTILVKSLAKVLGLNFSRVQFTADLMPSDLTGTQVLQQDRDGRREFEFKPGPIFANLVLADEVNRSGPKTQSSLLEAMAEHQVSVLGKTYPLSSPFLVMATQNPIELEGTYPLPEAQLDRFLFKVLVEAPSSAELKEILRRTTSAETSEPRQITREGEASSLICDFQQLVRRVVIPQGLDDIIVGLMQNLTPTSNSAVKLAKEYVRYGPGTRAAQALIMGAKVQALMDKRANIDIQDIRAIAKPALRHRLILNFQAQAEDVTADEIIADALS